MENVIKQSGKNLHFNLGTKKMVDFFSSGKKGGALLSALHSNMQHGDPFVKSLVRHTLNLVSCKHELIFYSNPNGLEDY